MIVGLTAPNRSGKTTLANHLVEHHGFTRASLATEVRYECMRRVPEVDFFDNDIKDTYNDVLECTPRDYLIHVGTTEVRAADPNFWLKKLEGTIRAYQTRGIERFVVDDVRFLNEMKWIKERGQLILIFREEAWRPEDADLALIELYESAFGMADDCVVNESLPAARKELEELLGLS